mmetsp:Transcript_5605/g.7882  ORF Transcript_5605/g.7882 Transcript_5605/m.7882 type:complete len:473 (-) Transcript_5605:1468-2886(-)
MINALAVVVSAVAVILGFVSLRKRRETDDPPVIRRKMSFQSRSLYQNMFPADAEIMSIINAEFEMSYLPSKDEFVSQLMDLCSEKPELVRLRSRVEEVGSSDYRFTEIEDLRGGLSRVVHVEIVPDDDARNALVEKIIGTNLPLNGLLHSYYLIQNQGGRSAVLFRFHHAIGDAMGLIDSYSNILTLEDGSPLVHGKTDAKGSRQPLKLGAVPKALVKLVTAPFISDSKTLLTCSSDETGGPLKRIGTRKLARTLPFPLEYVKAIKNSVGNGCTVNDVLTAVLGGCLKKYVQETTNGQPLKLRALVPVVLPRKKSDMLRNRWSFVSVDLHSQVDDAKSRLLDVHNEMEVIKASGEALLTLAFHSIGEALTSLSMKRRIISNQFASHSVVFSNVQGPLSRVRLCGIPVEHISIPFPNVRLQAIALSYNGEVTVTFCADDGRLPNPDRLTKLFMEELEVLGSAANISSSQMLLP